MNRKIVSVLAAFALVFTGAAAAYTAQEGSSAPSIESVSDSTGESSSEQSVPTETTVPPETTTKEPETTTRDYTGTYDKYVTKVTNLNFRKSPNGEIISVLPLGTEVWRVSTDGDWHKVIYGDDTGYVYAPYTAKFNTNYSYPAVADKRYSTHKAVIDVSEYQGVIDWAKVAASGVWGAVIRIGDRGYSTRKLFEDAKFPENYAGAKANGLHVGIYYYSAAMSAADAAEEARFVLSLMEKYGVELDIPVFYDVEDAVTSRMGQSIIRECADAFINEIEAAGIPCGVYTYASWANSYMSGGYLGDKIFWLADWTGSRNYLGDYYLHQFTSSGIVSGINGDVDISICYFDFPLWMSEVYYSGEAYSLGDVDGNGKINSSDARLVLRASASLIVLSGRRFEAGDLNSDGKLTAAEARRILRYSAQLETSLL